MASACSARNPAVLSSARDTRNNRPSERRRAASLVASPSPTLTSATARTSQKWGRVVLPPDVQLGHRYEQGQSGQGQQEQYGEDGSARGGSRRLPGDLPLLREQCWPPVPWIHVDADTPALRALGGSSLRFDVVRTSRPGTVEESAALQGIRVEQLLRTIVVRRGAGDYVLVLLPGGRQIDWPKLRAHLGVSRLSLPDEDEAREATGYERGAITPFGTTRAWPVVADATVEGHSRVAIGGGGRGVNLHVAASDLLAFLAADVADVSRPAGQAARPGQGSR